MKNWTIAKRIVVGFSVLLSIVIALGLLSFLELKQIEANTTVIAADTIPGLLLMETVTEQALNNRLIVARHLSSLNAAEMEELERRFAANADAITAELDEYGRIATTDADRALLERVVAARNAFREQALQIFARSRQSTNAETVAATYQIAVKELEPLAVQLVETLDEAVAHEKAAANAAIAAIRKSVDTSEAGLLAGVVGALCVGGLVAWGIVRSIASVLRTVSIALGDGAAQVASAAAQVSGSSQSLAAGAGQQAASIEESSASLEELASMTRRNAENAQKATELTKQTRGAADKGAADMQAMTAAMDALKLSSDQSAKIIKTIDEIAFQTNILALNAAVEAARAGEAGMGFAVVADEVRGLAQRSAHAAKETATKIEEALGRTGQGVELSAKVATTLNEIVGKIRDVDELVAEVAGASREQTQGISQINTAVGQMDKVTQSNAAAAEESAAAAEELNAQAEVMKRSVGELAVLVGGGNGSATKASATGTLSLPRVPQPTPARADFTKVQPRSRKEPQLAGIARRGDIPMEGDFKEF